MKWHEAVFGLCGGCYGALKLEKTHYNTYCGTDTMIELKCVRCGRKPAPLPMIERRKKERKG